MCGIVGIHFKNPRDMGVRGDNLEKLVDELLLGIEHRGRDATGLLTVDAGGRPNLVKGDLSARDFIKWRDTCPRRVRTILGHTRFATQGTPMLLENNHPVQSGSCFAIHNGHISNDTELFTEFSLERNAEVDSEIIPALLSMVGLDKARDALELLDGNYAVAAVDPERFPNTTILAKGWSSPVEVYENNYAVMWASTKETILKAVEKVFGIKLPNRNIESLGLGELLVMTGDQVERLKFKPLTKYRQSSITTNYGTGYSTYSNGKWDDDDDDLTILTPDTYTEVSDFMSEECAACGCERLYHGSGSNFSGPCNYINADTDFACRCIEFKVAPPLRQSPWEYCDGCGREFVMGDLDKVGQKYLCVICAKDPAVEGTTAQLTSVAATDLRKRAEDVLVRYELAKDMAEDDAQAFDVREESINEHVCAMASAKTGQEPAYINWLVNESKSEVIESDSTGYLTEAKAIAGKAYYDAWVKLNDEIEEIEAAQFPLSVASVVDACDTETACPDGKSWCDGGKGNRYCGSCWANRDEEIGVVAEEELVG